MLLIKRIITELGWSQAELARQSRVVESGVSKYVNGKMEPYKPERERIAKAVKWAGDPMELFKEVA